MNVNHLEPAPLEESRRLDSCSVSNAGKTPFGSGSSEKEEKEFEVARRQCRIAEVIQCGVFIKS